MVASLAADCLAAGIGVTALRDRRLDHFHLPGCHVVAVDTPEGERRAIECEAADAAWSVVIAPEIGGALADRVRWVEAAGGRLLSPGSGFVAITGDKRQTSRGLAAAGVSVPQVQLLELQADGAADLPVDFPYPAVVKPADGAGSLGVQRVWAPQSLFLNVERAWLIERYHPGTAASVAVLCGPVQTLPLPPFGQRLNATLEYQGGSRICDAQLVERAQELAVRAVAALGPTIGYVGVDVVLGVDPAGGGDRVIEINPRLTTSYIGLRQTTTDNLGAAMLAVAEGRPAALSFHDRPVQFAVGADFSLEVSWTAPLSH